MRNKHDHDYEVQTDARLDISGRNTSEINTGEFSDPDLYHLAVRIGPAEGKP